MKKILTLPLLLLFSFPLMALQEGQLHIGIFEGVEKVRLAVPEFKQVSADPQTGKLLNVFNQTLWNDLESAGIFELVSKSFYPLQVPGLPEELTCPGQSAQCNKLEAWSNPP